MAAKATSGTMLHISQGLGSIKNVFQIHDKQTRLVREFILKSK